MVDEDKSGTRVVARLRDGSVLKGYLDEPLELNFDAILADALSGLPREVSLRIADSNDRLSVPLQTLKALFFVKTFDGRKDYSEVKFFEKNPPIKGLWIRVRFYDNEHLEGVVRNSIHFLTEPGFYLKPPDPLSNNEVLYVVKEALADFRVLGVRMDF